MTENEITLVRKTWRIFREIDAEVIGDVFYSRLFLYNPSLRKMFPRKMSEQYKKLMDMMNMIVARLDKQNDFENEIILMTHRHIRYGVRPAHYKLVGKSLLWTLQHGLGKDWNIEVEAAWKNCYSSISAIMLTVSNEKSVQQK